MSSPGSTADSTEAAKPTRSIERAFALLTTVADHPAGISLSDAARAVELAPTTALRQLKSLEQLGFLERRPNGNFVAGLGLYQLALRVTREPALPRLARPLLEELTAETGESSYLAVRVDDATGMYVAQASSSRRIREVSWLGEQIDLTDTALGAALSGRVDADGVAVRVGAVEDDVTAIVAPVRDASEHVVGAISLLGPTYRLTTDIVATWRPAVADTAARLGGG